MMYRTASDTRHISGMTDGAGWVIAGQYRLIERLGHGGTGVARRTLREAQATGASSWH